jgi:predicted N-formylglutamate amidohydrolase
LCEHASNHIPAEYQSLGLTDADLDRHIAFDLGAAQLTRSLSELLDAPAFLGTYSRLLIDLNRPLAAPSSIPLRSEDTDIPGNVDLRPEEVERRATMMFAPFHARVAAHLDRRQLERRPTRLVTIHSFTPMFLGIKRPWHAGVLFDRANSFGSAIIDRLRVPDLIVDANVPYKTDRTEDYAIPIHGDDRGIPAILIEIRNDLLVSTAGIDDWARNIGGSLG